MVHAPAEPRRRGEYHGVAELRTAFAYGSLIAATDPVATLATYASLKVDPVPW